MIIEEKKAGEYQCPTSNSELNCCGAKCMAWVWDNESGVSYSSKKKDGSRQMTPDEKANTTAGRMGMDFILEEAPTGHCGLVDHEI